MEVNKDWPPFFVCCNFVCCNFVCCIYNLKQYHGTILKSLQKLLIHFKSRFNIILLYDTRSESRASGVILRQWLKTKEAFGSPFYYVLVVFMIDTVKP